MDKDIYKYLCMFRLKFGDEYVRTQVALDLKNELFGFHYRTGVVSGMINYLLSRDVALLEHTFEYEVKLTKKAIELIEKENNDGV